MAPRRSEPQLCPDLFLVHPQYVESYNHKRKGVSNNVKHVSMLPAF